MAWIRIALLRLRDERLSALGLAGLVLVTAFIAAVSPQLLDHVADSTLRSTVEAAPSATRNIQFIELDHLESDTSDPFASIAAEQARIFEQLPASIAALVSERGWTADSGRWHLPGVPGDPATMRLRIDPGAMDRLRLTAGRWPTAAVDTVPDSLSKDPSPPPVKVFEIALSTETARGFQLELGATRELPPDISDTMVGQNATIDIAVRLVGTFDVLDETDPWWLGDTSLARPTIRSPGGDATIADSTALLSPDAHTAYVNLSIGAGLFLRYTFRDYVDASRLLSSRVDRLVLDFKQLETAFPTSSASLPRNIGGPPGLREGLRPLLETYQAQWASARAILTVGAIGPGAVALGALALVAGLAGQRRRSALALAHGRGASTSQVAMAVVAEGALLAVPPAVASVVIAGALVPAHAELASALAGLAVAAGAVVLLLVAALPASTRPAFGSGRETGAPRRATTRRTLFEGLIVVAAVAGAALLRERGIRGASSTGQLAQADPFIAAVPALLGLAAGLLAIRLFPYPMRGLAWLAQRGRGLVPVLAMRRATDGRRAAPALIVVLVAAAILAFSSSVLLYIGTAADAVAWRDTGAAYRIDSTTELFPPSFDASALPQVEAVAEAHRAIVNMGPQYLNVEVIALPLEAYAKVTAGTPAAFDLPLDFYGTNVSVIPIMVSKSEAARSDGVKPGADVQVSIEGSIYPMHVVGIVDDLPGISTRPEFAIASRDQMRALKPSLLGRSVIFLKAPPSAEGGIRAAVATELPAGTSVASRAAESEAIRSSPIARAVVGGMTAAAVVALAYAIIALAASLALAGAARAIEIAHLRMLGLSGLQAAGLVVVENGPVVVTACGLGLGLGRVMFSFLRQGLGLEALIGSAVDVPVIIQPAQLAIVLGAIVGVVVLGLALGALMQRGAAPTAAVRRGFE